MIPESPSSVSNRPSKNRTSFWLLCIVLLALLVRMLHYAAISKTAYPQIPVFFAQSDMHAFLEWAFTILNGDFLGRNTYHPYFEWMQAIAPKESWYRWWGGEGKVFHQTPLYPYFLAFLLWISNRSVGFVYFVQLAIGALQPLVLFFLTRRVFDERAGLVASALSAFYGPFVFQESTLLRDWLPPILEPLALLMIYRAVQRFRSVDFFIAGVLVGVAFLTKETILLFFPAVLLWLIWSHRSQWLKAGQMSALLVCGFVCALTPLMVRNALVGAPILGLSARVPEPLILGNAADSFPAGASLPDSMKGILERSGGKSLRVFLETLRTYHGDWIRFLNQQWLKFRILLDPMELPNNLSYSYAAEISPMLRWMIGYGVVLPFGIAGIVFSQKQRNKQAILILYGVLAFVTLMAFVVVARYRLFLVPVLVLYAASGIVRLYDAMKARRWSGVTYCITLLLFVVLTQYYILPVRELRQRIAFVIHPPEYFLSAHIYATEGQFERCIGELQRLREKALQHGFLPFAQTVLLAEADYRVAWAEKLIRDRQPSEARKQIELSDRIRRQVSSAFGKNDER